MFGFGKKVITPTQANVTFTRSKITLPWSESDGTLLDLAEQHGLTPPSSCRSGHCGACKAKITTGNVAYPEPISAEIAEGEVLLCSAIPATEKDQTAVDINIDL